MVELKKKYQIGKRRFGLINWIGMTSLYKKEVLRFIVVAGQTIIGPTVTALLFLIVISLDSNERPIGNLRLDHRFSKYASLEKIPGFPIPTGYFHLI